MKARRIGVTVAEHVLIWLLCTFLTLLVFGMPMAVIVNFLLGCANGTVAVSRVIDQI